MGSTFSDFISISERDIETETPEVEAEIVVKVFIFLCK